MFWVGRVWVGAISDSGRIPSLSLTIQAAACLIIVRGRFSEVRGSWYLKI